jgi:hypothetical protein
VVHILYSFLTVASCAFSIICSSAVSFLSLPSLLVDFLFSRSTLLLLLVRPTWNKQRSIVAYARQRSRDASSARLQQIERKGCKHDESKRAAEEARAEEAREQRRNIMCGWGFRNSVVSKSTTLGPLTLTVFGYLIGVKRNGKCVHNWNRLESPRFYNISSPFYKAARNKFWNCLLTTEKALIGEK